MSEPAELFRMINVWIEILLPFVGVLTGASIAIHVALFVLRRGPSGEKSKRKNDEKPKRGLFIGADETHFEVIEADITGESKS